MSCRRMNLRVLPKTENTSETEQTFPAAGLKFSYAAMDESRLSAFLIEGQPSVFRV